MIDVLVTFAVTTLAVIAFVILLNAVDIDTRTFKWPAPKLILLRLIQCGAVGVLLTIIAHHPK